MTPQSKSYWRYEYDEQYVSHSTSVSITHTVVSECSCGPIRLDGPFDVTGFSGCLSGGGLEVFLASASFGAFMDHRRIFDSVSQDGER